MHYRHRDPGASGGSQGAGGWKAEGSSKSVSPHHNTLCPSSVQTLLQMASEEEAAVQRRAAESSTFRSRRKEIIAVKKKDTQRPQEDVEKQPPSSGALQTVDSVGGRSSEDGPPTQENMADCTYNICKFEGSGIFL